MPAPKGQRFFPARQPATRAVVKAEPRALGPDLSALTQMSGLQGLGQIGPIPASNVGPAVMPTAVREAPLSEQWDESLNDLFAGKAFVRAKVTNGFFGKYAPRAIRQVKQTFISETPMFPGDVQTVLGGFTIPRNMVFLMTFIEFFANKSIGMTEGPIEPGATGRNLTFGILDNGTQIGVQGFVLTPPAGGFLFGVYQNNQEPPQNPSRSFQAGPGKIINQDGGCYYIEGTHQLVFIANVLPALPYAVTSTAVTFEGVLVDKNSLDAKLQV